MTAHAELLRRGKSAAQLEARILIDGKVALTAVGIFGAQRESAVRGVPVAPAAAVPVETVPDAPHGGLRPAFTRHFDMRWGAGLPPFSGAEHSDAQIFVRYRNEPVSSDALLVCLADAIPPSAISVFKAPAMLSSMNWTLEFVTPMNEAERAGWLRFDSGLTAAGDGYGWGKHPDLVGSGAAGGHQPAVRGLVRVMGTGWARDSHHLSINEVMLDGIT
ncbi:MAG: thioesterase family protein [Rhodocyclaceae bacterium]|nr:thioesterase family protein [Rhodocyclaceae bacterium]